MNRRTKWLGVITLVYFMGVAFFLVALWRLPEPDRSMYRRYDHTSSKYNWCGEVPDGDVCYEDVSTRSKFIYFFDERADGILDRVIVKGSGGTHYAIDQVIYRLHSNDCDDLLGVNSGTEGGPVTICLADDDAKAEAFQQMYVTVRQNFSEAHPAIQGLPENNKP